MTKSSSRKKAICKVGDRILAPGDKWGIVADIKSKGTFPYIVRWDNGVEAPYKEADFEKFGYQIHPPEPASVDIEEEDEAQLDLDFSREQEWKVGDRCRVINPNAPESVTAHEWIVDGFTTATSLSGDLNLVIIKREVEPRGFTTRSFESKWLKLCSDNLTSVQELVSDSHSQDSNSEDLPLLAYANAMSIAKISSQSDTLACPSIQAFKQELATVGQSVSENSTSLQPHHPVHRSVSKVKGSEPTTKETVSPQLLKRSPKSNQSTSRSKMCEDSSPVLGDQATEEEPTSTIFSVTFPAAGTMSNGRWCEVASIAAPLLEKEYYWLDSPGGLSSVGRSPGQSKLESSLKEAGYLQSGECINPAFLEDAFEIPLGWSDHLVSQSATALLEGKEKPSETVLTPELQQSHSKESSTSTVSFKLEVCPSSKKNCTFTPGIQEDMVGCLSCKNWFGTGTDTGFLILEKFPELQRALDSDITDSLEKSETHTSKQIGSLYKDTEWRTNKAGEKIQYPRVDGERDSENDDHWYWYISYVVRDGNHKKSSRKAGGWKDTTAYVPRKNLSLCRELMRAEFPVELIVEVCQVKWLWNQRRGEYLIGESKPETCPRLVVVDFQEKQLFISSSEWGELTLAKRHTKQRLIGEAIANGKSLTYIKEVVANQ